MAIRPPAILYTEQSMDFAESLHRYLAQTYRLPFEKGTIHFKRRLSGEIKKVEFDAITGEFEGSLTPLPAADGRRVYIVNQMRGQKSYNSDRWLMEVCSTNASLRNSHVSEIYYVFPHLPYQRDDDIFSQFVRVFSASVPPKVHDKAIMTTGLHSPQSEGYLNREIPMMKVNARDAFADYYKGIVENPKEIVVVAPFEKAAERSRDFAKNIGVPAGQVSVIMGDPTDDRIVRDIMGPNLDGRICVVYNDCIDKGDVLSTRVEALLARYDPKSISFCAEHGIFSNPGVLKNARNKKCKVVITDTIAQDTGFVSINSDNLTVLPMAKSYAREILTLEKEIGDYPSPKKAIPAAASQI